MKQEVCVLPVRCEKCSAVFDLWYDLQEQEYGEVAVLTTLRQRMGRSLRDSLCWDCRQGVLEKLGDDKREHEEEDNNEMVLEFE